MLRALAARLTYANVVATLALFIALGGASYAAITITGRNVRDGSLTGRDIRRNSVGGRQIDEGSLGTVRRARVAVAAGTALTVDGRTAGDFAPSKVEKVRQIGAGGQPPFQNGWSASGGLLPGFWKDQGGMVHFQGQIHHEGPAADLSVVFTLPRGYWPPLATHFVTASTGNTYASIDVEPDGRVVWSHGSGDPGDVGLNGIEYRYVP